MIVLNDTTESVTVKLSAAVSFVQPTLVAAFADTPDSSGVHGNSVNLSGTTKVTAVAAPASGKQRAVKSLSIYNGDSVGVTITVSKTISGTDYPIVKMSIDSGQTLSMVNGLWSVNSNSSGTRPIAIQLAVSDEVTAIAVTSSALVFRAPYAFTLTGVRASLTTASSSGLPTFDIKKNGSTIMTTLVTIDASEKTSVTAATPPVIATPSIADDDEITIAITVAGTGAKGAKITLIGTRPV